MRLRQFPFEICGVHKRGRQRELNKWVPRAEIQVRLEQSKKSNVSFLSVFVFETFRIFTDAQGCWHVGGSDPWCLETPRLSEFSHCMPCHGHSRCMFHAACTPRSCTAHARDFDARAMRLSWSSGHDTPHVWPASYPMIRNLRTLK